MTIEQTIADEIAHVHVEIDAASDAFRQRLHDAVRSWANVHRQNQELQALVNRQRAEIERLTGALRTADEQTDDLLQECNDLRAANRAYAKTLADLQASIGREEDDDLVEAARSLMAEVKRLIMQDILKRERAERAESECERLRAGIALVRAYKAAVDAQSGVADTQAALCAWLEENDHVPHP